MAVGRMERVFMAITLSRGRLYWNSLKDSQLPCLCCVECAPLFHHGWHMKCVSMENLWCKCRVWWWWFPAPSLARWQLQRPQEVAVIPPNRQPASIASPPPSGTKTPKFELKRLFTIPRENSKAARKSCIKRFNLFLKLFRFSNERKKGHSRRRRNGTRHTSKSHTIFN